MQITNNGITDLYKNKIAHNIINVYGNATYKNFLVTNVMFISVPNCNAIFDIPT